MGTQTLTENTWDEINRLYGLECCRENLNSDNLCLESPNRFQLAVFLYFLFKLF